MCWLQQSAQLWHLPSFLLIPLMIVGCIECLAGYWTWRFLVGLNGAVLGFIAGAMLCVLLGAPTLALLGALVGAVAGAALFGGVLPLGNCIFAFGSVTSLVILLGHIASVPPHWLMPIAAGTGLAGAVAVVAGSRPAMIAITGIAGAQQVAAAWRAYSLSPDRIPVPDALGNAEWGGLVALTCAGLLVQLFTSRERRAELPVTRAMSRGATVTYSGNGPDSGAISLRGRTRTP